MAAEAAEVEQYSRHWQRFEESMYWVGQDSDSDFLRKKAICGAFWIETIPIAKADRSRDFESNPMPTPNICNFHSNSAFTVAFSFSLSGNLF